MTNEKLKEYKKNLNRRYTGMTEELGRELGFEYNQNIVPKIDDDFDLNKDGKFDDKDLSMAGKALSRGKKIRRVI